jgi:hypothetical protein
MGAEPDRLKLPIIRFFACIAGAYSPKYNAIEWLAVLAASTWLRE